MRRRLRRLVDAKRFVDGQALSATLVFYVLSRRIAFLRTAPLLIVGPLYGVIVFAGSFMATLALVILVTQSLRQNGHLGEAVHTEHFHDLGKLLFGFVCFWAYVSFSQFMLQWYGNMPEETYFIFYRLYGAWRPVGVAVFLLVFLIPFVGLLGVKPKHVFVDVRLDECGLSWYDKRLSGGAEHRIVHISLPEGRFASFAMLTNGMGVPLSWVGAGDTPGRPSAGRTKFSNATKVETGLPGRPKNGLPSISPNPCGIPGCIATL